MIWHDNWSNCLAHKHNNTRSIWLSWNDRVSLLVSHFLLVSWWSQVPFADSPLTAAVIGIIFSTFGGYVSPIPLTLRYISYTWWFCESYFQENTINNCHFYDCDVSMNQKQASLIYSRLMTWTWVDVLFCVVLCWWTIFGVDATGLNDLTWMNWMNAMNAMNEWNEWNGCVDGMNDDIFHHVLIDSNHDWQHDTMQHNATQCNTIWLMMQHNMFWPHNINQSYDATLNSNFHVNLNLK
jgi:hypothetical protein